MHSLIRKECVVLIFLCFAVAQYAAAAVSAFDGQDIPSGQETGGKNEAEEKQTRSFRKEYTIWFDINKWQIDTAFRGNAETIRRMRLEVDSLLANGIITTDSISVISAASPDGRDVYNKWLSRKRGLAAYDLLESQYPEIDPAIIIVDPIGEDWETLRRIIYEDSQMPMREELLELAGADLPNDEKEKRLRQMKAAFRYILKHHMYLMRASSVTFNISMPAISLDSVKGPDIPLPEIGRGKIRKAGYAPAPQRQMTRKMILAARTNLLVPAAPTITSLGGSPRATCIARKCSAGSWTPNTGSARAARRKTSSPATRSGLMPASDIMTISGKRAATRENTSISESIIHIPSRLPRTDSGWSST